MQIFMNKFPVLFKSVYEKIVKSGDVYSSTRISNILDINVSTTI